jgi:hypothetical protein
MFGLNADQNNDEKSINTRERHLQMCHYGK